MEKRAPGGPTKPPLASLARRPGRPAGKDQLGPSRAGWAGLPIGPGATRVARNQTPLGVHSGAMGSAGRGQLGSQLGAGLVCRWCHTGQVYREIDRGRSRQGCAWRYAPWDVAPLLARIRFHCTGLPRNVQRGGTMGSKAHARRIRAQAGQPQHWRRGLQAWLNHGMPGFWHGPCDRSLRAT